VVEDCIAGVDGGTCTRGVLAGRAYQTGGKKRRVAGAASYSCANSACCMIPTCLEELKRWSLRKRRRAKSLALPTSGLETEARGASRLMMRDA